MNHILQLLSFLVSFLFGIIFSFISRYHYNMVFKLSKMPRYVLTVLFILDVSLAYILLLYYVNHGIVHIYFVVVTLIGYLFENKITSFVKRNVKRCSFIDNFFRK